MNRYKLLNEVLIEWNESSKEDSDNVFLNSEDIKKRLPVHKLYLVNGIKFYMININDKFWIGETLVTQDLWRAVTGEYYNTRFWNASKGNNPLCPAEKIIWEDCLNFIKKLNILTKEKFRIPTTSEWEEACGNEFKEYFNSIKKDDLIKGLGEYAWFMENSDEHAHPVAEKLPNEYGIFDILGNLWEWCIMSGESWPAGRPVCKGGSYRIPVQQCTISNIWLDALYYGSRANGMGLRLAMD